MAHFRFRNVNDAFRGLVDLFANKQAQAAYNTRIEGTSSRNGPVLAIQEPVIITFEKPNERVLFNQARDCNPFFHLFESLYMLSGGNLIKPLAYYAPQMKNYSDDGVTQNGAYGYRWIHAPGPHNPNGLDTVDQLQLIINHLKAKPDSRRAVLQMWNVEDDLLKMDTSKDICCNTSVMFSIRDTQGEDESFAPMPKCLDMTVINRSNDLVWGMLGANVVHFSFLQEYMAANLGVEVGVYNQMSNNLHIYTENNSGFKHEEWLADETPDYYSNPGTHTSKLQHFGMKEFMPGGINEIPKGSTITMPRIFERVPLIRDPAVFEAELPKFINNACNHDFLAIYTEPFLNWVATPLLWSFELHKKREYDLALNALKICNADDWRIAATNWLMKRKQNWENKNATTSLE